VDIKADVYLNPDDGAVDCSGTATVEVVSRGPWFQTKGSDVHGNAEVSSSIPNTCQPDPACQPYLSLALDGYNGLVSSGGSVNWGDGLGTGQVDNWYVENENIDFSGYGYQYFSDLIESPTEIGGNPLSSDLNSLDGSYIVGGDGNLILPNSPWNVAAGQKVVIFVPGSLTIKKRINLGTNKNNFLAFIVHGDINVEGNVTDSGVNPALEGVFISDGTINIETSSNVFTGKGIFVGLTDVTLGRDLGSDNDNTAAETFIYRPDFFMNAPDEFKKARYTWKEVAP